MVQKMVITGGSHGPLLPWTPPLKGKIVQKQATGGPGGPGSPGGPGDPGDPVDMGALFCHSLLSISLPITVYVSNEILVSL